MKKWLEQKRCEGCENRIVMLTDVGDNSIEGEKAFVELASRESAINLTVVGISNEFRSQVCEALKDIRGFSYFCAVNEGDIKRYVFEEFDFSFFPSAYNLEIGIVSKDIASVPDSDRVAEYNGGFLSPRESYEITRTKTSFPSAVEVHGGTVFTFGGLILLKLRRFSKEGSFAAQVRVAY